MVMLLASDMSAVERRVLERAARVHPHPPGWNEREEDTHNLLLLTDCVQCHLTDHLAPMRAAERHPEWQQFIEKLSELATRDVVEAGWVWLIELILAEYTFTLKDSWAWGASILFVDGATKAHFGNASKEVHLMARPRVFELQNKHIRDARREWYDKHDTGAGGKRRLMDLLFYWQQRGPPGDNEITLQSGSFAPVEVAKSVHDDDADAIAKWIDDEGGSPNAIVRMGEQTGTRAQRCPGTRLLTIAARKGFLSTAQVLLERGSDPALSNDDGTTPLMAAAEEARLDLVRCLLVFRADTLVRDRDGWVALTYVNNRVNRAEYRASIVQLLSRPESVLEAPLQSHTVLVTGLSSQPQLNGRRGVAVSYDAMSGRYVVQLENGPAVRVRQMNLAKVDAAGGVSTRAASSNAASSGASHDEDPQAKADQELRIAMETDDIDLEDLKTAITELQSLASAELLKEARRKRDQLKERARKAVKSESNLQRKVRMEAETAVAAAEAAKEAARAAAEDARTAAAQEILARQSEEAERQKEASLCVVCLDEPKTHIFVPCGHYSCCERCCDLISNGPAEKRLCPLCKGAITMGMKVFG